jgi:hypothetical protein
MWMISARAESDRSFTANMLEVKFMLQNNKCIKQAKMFDEIRSIERCLIKL